MRMAQIMKIITVDDAMASKIVETMVCPTFEDAKAAILKDLNDGFGESFTSLVNAAEELKNDLFCEYDGIEFEWYDNGQGVRYIIGDFDVNMEGFQTFCVL